jgi:lactam utilization protein B
MMRDGTVLALDGSEVAVEPETICVHGDGMAQYLRARVAPSSSGFGAPSG